MIQKFKLKVLMMAFVAITGFSFQSCGGDDEPEVKVYTAPSFKAINTSTSGEKVLTASDDKVVINLTYSVTLTINGVSQNFTGFCSSNELPVMGGNEIEIAASFEDDSATSHVIFTLPDGTTELVSKTEPTCKWTVPANFTAGDKIVAQWADKSERIMHPSLSSSITLIEF